MEKLNKPCVKCGSTDRMNDGRCHPCIKAGNRAAYHAHKEERNAKRREYYLAHYDHERERIARHAREHIVESNAAKTSWAKANPEKVKAAQAIWDNAHPEKKRAYARNRQAQKKTGGSFTADDIKAIMKRQKKRCVVCHVNISQAYHIDHMMPLKLGGSNYPSNLQLLCPHCNKTKGAKHPIDFMQSRGFLI